MFWSNSFFWLGVKTSVEAVCSKKTKALGKTTVSAFEGVVLVYGDESELL